MSSKTNIKHIFCRQGKNSTFDGLSKILRSQRPISKRLWTLALVFLTGVCSFILLKTILNYFAYSIVTTITVRQEMPAKMPTIIVCNSNGLLTKQGISWAKKLFANYNITNVNNYLHLENEQFPRQLKRSNILSTRTIAMSAARNPTLSDEFRKSLGLTIQDMLVSCTFNSVECTAANFTWIYNTFYGNCFKFSPSISEYISQAGKFSGLSMELFVGQAVQVEQVAKTNGIHLFIVNETVKINAFSDGFDVPAGKMTTIFIDKKRIKKLEKPYGQCTQGLTSMEAYPTPCYRLTFAIYNTYRQRDCYHACFQQRIIAMLGCYFATFPYLSNTTVPACLQGKNLFASLNYFSAFFVEDVAKKCAECPMECDSEFYTLTAASLAYPTKVYAQMLASQSQILARYNNVRPTYEQLTQSLVSVSVNYNQLGYTQIREIKKTTLVDLVTNVGAIMGLIMGVSFLSMFEIVELLVVLVYFLGGKLFKSC